MKLKIKHIQQPQQAHRVEVPNGASLEELRSAVLTSLAFSKTTAASQVSLSLNKKVCNTLPLRFETLVGLAKLPSSSQAGAHAQAFHAACLPACSRVET